MMPYEDEDPVSGIAIPGEGALIDAVHIDMGPEELPLPVVTELASVPAVETLAEVEPVNVANEAPLPPPPSPTEEPAPSASFVPPAPPVHGDVTIRGWFNDVFANLIATGRVRAADAESHLQDLLKRLGY